MFYPRTYLGKLFKLYLLMPTHWGKVRVQNFFGKLLFPKGIDITNRSGLRFNLTANDWMTRIILLHKNYEDESLQLARTILKDGGVFVDIGANFGLYSCTLSYNNENITTIAVEPNYMVLSKLIENIRLNDLAQKVKVVNTAISRQEELLSLQLENYGNLGTAHYESAANGSLNVAGYPLQTILTNSQLSTIDLIKIDIEGKEMDVLESFPFEKFHIKNIIVEYNSLCRTNLSAFRDFFNKKGFDLYNVRGVKIKDKKDIIEDNIWVRNRQYI